MAAVTTLRVITPAENAGFRILDENWQHGEILRQIGRGNLAAISGLRFEKRPTGITLPVAHGYSVHIDLDGNDTYVVRRVFSRSGVQFIKGEVRGVYCEDLSDTAYEASCYASVEFGS